MCWAVDRMGDMTWYNGLGFFIVKMQVTFNNLFMWTNRCR
jgi:hypothetical protein